MRSRIQSRYLFSNFGCISEARSPLGLILSTTRWIVQRNMSPNAGLSGDDATISNLCKQKRYRDALFAFQSLESQTLHRNTYVQLVLVCSHLKSIHDGRLIHRHLSRVFTDVILNNHILSMYGKCGAMDDARQLFERMAERNLVSWTAMISGYSQSNKEIDAVGFYLRMLRSGLLPDHFTLGSVIRSCSGMLDLELGRQMHCHCIKLGYCSDLIVQNAIVTMYSKTDRIDDAFLEFLSIAEKDLISWSSMIAGLAQQAHELEALCLFKEMICSGNHRPNEFHFGSAFSACRNINLLDYGEQMHNLCIKIGLDKDAFTGCSLTDMYARCGKLDCTKKAFYDVQVPDLVSWNSVICAFTNKGLMGEALQLLAEMRLSGFEPDDITIRCLLCACTTPASLFLGQLFHSYLTKMSFDTDIAVCNSLVNMYAKCAELETALNLFEEMGNLRNIVSWNTVLTACLQNQRPDEVLRLSGLMWNLRNEFDQITFSCVLSASADLACIEVGSQVHCHAFKTGFDEMLVVRNGLINMYAKCGNLNKARNLFELTGNDCDVFSWSSLIVGYAQFGNGRESLELFKRMQNIGIRPNHVTFVGVLTACSHIGLVDEGLHYYNMMNDMYAICPTREHCSCIVDLLSRAGRLNEAESFIHNIPIEPDLIMWKTLLAACRVQNNVDIGKRAAISVLHIDPFDSSAYVLLCSIYASSGCWDDFARLRKFMKSFGVKKSPGKSWILVKGEVSVFSVEDRSHKQLEDIYETLRVLDFDMRKVDENHPMNLSWQRRFEAY
ncbi:hypothetical protein HPP92_027976 [Vanilla planifolia]|uniref:Pentatricopeptide repeat-containing protein n=1 Tax=Vanilla planifolia TaxID=51239 RepID=A0A835P7W2_VANPL|nr:hypothetical protein HPP92_027976 [Vanilla planifolia]